jgi:adenine deaminase
MKIEANIVDIKQRQIYFGRVEIENGRIKSIVSATGESDRYILPGFVDAHIHIESSMLVPSEFARLAVVHGTVAAVSDPHEIANVLGIEGVRYMINDGGKVPFKFNFGAPSCVPATNFETAGAVIDVKGVEELLNMDEIKYLAEMMNYPGVLYRDEAVMAKIEAAKRIGKPIDGHAPGLMDEDAINYINAGISTDHECFTYEEALGKIKAGMKVLIREGSAAKNFEALIDLLPQYPDQIMFCSDDKHPDDLIEGHINQLVVRALEKGCDLFDVLQAACLNPVEHYDLDVGLLQPGNPADFILVKDLKQFQIEATYINGIKIAESGISLIEETKSEVINHFNASPVHTAGFKVKALSGKMNVIQAIDGELITKRFEAAPKLEKEWAISDIERDILKMAVVNRYIASPPALAFINGFGLKKGAIASCVGHDSHNIIVVGVDDESISRAVNLIIENKGGIAAVAGREEKVLALPVAGIMTTANGYDIAEQYSQIDQFVKEEMKCLLKAPFMTLSFMALLVIPELKLSDKGLFDGKSFQFINLFT